MHLLQFPTLKYDVLAFREKTQLLKAYTPSWHGIVDGLSFAWGASELIVLLLNRKRRALHDFIAGTVVIHTGEAVVEV